MLWGAAVVVGRVESSMKSLVTPPGLVDVPEVVNMRERMGSCNMK